jgi:hypothetical protein
MTQQLNREMWDHFLEQLDAQVEGDFLALAAEYETIMGHPFHLGSTQQVMFSMLQQAMMSQNKQLLTSTVGFIAQLSIQLQAEFAVYSRDYSSDLDGHEGKKKRRSTHKTPIASKLWNFLHLTRAA